MRYRLHNIQESANTRAKKLIERNDALSTQEQEEVLKYLANSLHSSVILIRILAILQIFIATLYICMLGAGYPLVHTVFENNNNMTKNLTSSHSELTFTGAFTILISAILLIIGGLTDLRVCRRKLNIDASVIIEMSKKINNSNNNKDILLIWVPPHQYILGIISICTTFYWCYIMYTYYSYLAQQNQKYFTISDNWLEVILISWQPITHFIIGKTLQSIMSEKEDLIRLARMKYQYDKL